MSCRGIKTICGAQNLPYLQTILEREIIPENSFILATTENRGVIVKLINSKLCPCVVLSGIRSVTLGCCFPLTICLIRYFTADLDWRMGLRLVSRSD